ncbi:hypothetical protein ES705_22754 [subsurface metagenome]
MLNDFIFVQVWCCQCQDIHWHLLRPDGCFDCLACRSIGRLTTQHHPENTPFPATSLVSWNISARSVQQP